MNAGIVFTAGFVLVAAALAFMVLGAFEDTTVNACVLNTSASLFNGTAVNGNGYLDLVIANYVSGAVINFSGENGSFNTGAGCDYAVNSSVAVRANCLAPTTRFIFTGTNITNMTIYYTSLGSCAYPLNTYTALKKNDEVIRMGMSSLPTFGLALIGIFILLLVVAVGYRLVSD